MWYHKNVGGGRCPIVDTWWQTETGGHMITPLPGATPLVPGSCTLPLPGIMAGDRRRDRPRRAERARAASWSIKRPWPAMIRTIWGDPERFKKSYYPEELQGQVLPRRRRRDPRRGDRLLHDHGPHRRRAERLRPPPGHDGDRVGAGRQPARRRGRGRRPAGRPDRRGDLRVRRAEAAAPDRRRGEEDRQASCATGSARRSARSPSRRTSASATTCRRRAPARSCAGCCARSPRARRSRRTSRRWRTRHPRAAQAGAVAGGAARARPRAPRPSRSPSPFAVVAAATTQPPQLARATIEFLRRYAPFNEMDEDVARVRRRRGRSSATTRRARPCVGPQSGVARHAVHRPARHRPRARARRAPRRGRVRVRAGRDVPDQRRPRRARHDAALRGDRGSLLLRARRRRRRRRCSASSPPFQRFCARYIDSLLQQERRALRAPTPRRPSATGRCCSRSPRRSGARR